MKCERVEEYLSAYVERELDTVLQSRIEEHVMRCTGCSEQLAGLRSLWSSFDSIVPVEPPLTGEMAVIRALQQIRIAESARQSAPSLQFLDWLRGLRPAPIALGAGVATLVVAGSLVMNRGSEVQLGFVQRPAATAPSAAPSLEFDASVAADHTLVTLRQPEGSGRTLPPVARVTSAAGSTPLVFTCADGCSAPLRIARSPRPQVAEIAVSQAGARPGSYTLVAPGELSPTRTVTQTWVDAPLVEVVAAVSPALGRPVIIDQLPDRPITLRVEDASGIAALKLAAQRAGAHVYRQNGIYRVAALPAG